MYKRVYDPALHSIPLAHCRSHLISSHASHFRITDFRKLKSATLGFFSPQWCTFRTKVLPPYQGARHSPALKMEAARSSEMSVHICHIGWYIPKHRNIDLHAHRDNAARYNFRLET